MSKYINEGLSTEAELSSIVDKIAVVATLDHEFRILETNFNFINLLGKDTATLLRADFYQLLAPDTDGPYLAAMKDIILHGFFWNGELEFLTATENTVWLELNIVPLRSKAEKIRYKVIGFDITEKKTIKASLVHSLKFQDALMESAPVGFFLADESGACINVNSCWKKMTGMNLLTAAGEGWVGAIHPEDRESVVGHWKSFIEHNEVFNHEFRYVKKGGGISYVVASAVRVTQKKQTTIFRVEYDLSELRNNERIIHEQRSKVELNSRLAALGEMAAGIGHEINNPLAIISGLTERVKLKVEKHQDESEIILNLNKIQKNVERTAKIVKSMQSLVRHSHSDPFQTASLLEILDDAVALSSSRLSTNNIRLILNPNPLDLQVDCRPGEISQVLLNLIVNSCDAVSKLEERWIKIDLLDSGREVEVWVTDSGKGIDPELREKIFQPFFTTKEVGKGTGMGLAISRSIINAHGGDLQLAANAPNTRFIIRLPKTKD